MASNTASNILYVLLFFVVVIMMLFNYIIKSYSAWQKIGVKGPTPRFPFGNIEQVATKDKTMLNFWIKAYNNTKGRMFRGYFLYMQPILVVTDPYLIQCILIQDFKHFIHRGISNNLENEPLKYCLFKMKGHEWESRSQKVVPLFSSEKLAKIYPTLNTALDSLDTFINKASASNQELEINSLLKRFSADVMAKCVFGIDCNSIDYPMHDFYVFASQIHSKTISDKAKDILIKVFPRLKKTFGTNNLRSEIIDFYADVIKDVVSSRKKNDTKRIDFMQEFISLLNELTIQEVSAECISFFLFGFETIQNMLMFTLYELSLNEEIQNKLRSDIKGLSSGNVDDNLIIKQTYLDQILKETLRKYPPVSVIKRECTEEYLIPNTNIKLPLESQVSIPVYCVHRDPEYYINPEAFDPERFSDENNEKRKPFTYFPFGQGKRQCIAKDFVIMVVKAAVSLLVSKYKIKLGKTTPDKIKCDIQDIYLESRDTIYLNFTKTTDTDED